jgi:hypothetical protein
VFYNSFIEFVYLLLTLNRLLDLFQAKNTGLEKNFYLMEKVFCTNDQLSNKNNFENFKFWLIWIYNVL